MSQTFRRILTLERGLPHYLRLTSVRTLACNIKKGALFRFYKIFAIVTLLHGSESWTLIERQRDELETAELFFVKAVEGQ
jgi:hypothetical protein